MAICCHTPQFAWEADGEEQVLVCGGCGSVWGPTPDGSNPEVAADFRVAWGLLRDRVAEKKSWSGSALKDLMLDCLLESGNSG